MQLETELVLKARNANLLLLGLVLLLGVQLTGLTCLGERQVGPAAAVVEAMDHFPSPDGGVTDDGCPCHFTFQTVIVSPWSLVSPFTSMLLETPTRVVGTFIHSLFRPPVLS